MFAARTPYTWAHGLLLHNPIYLEQLGRIGDSPKESLTEVVITGNTGGLTRVLSDGLILHTLSSKSTRRGLGIILWPPYGLA